MSHSTPPKCAFGWRACGCTSMAVSRPRSEGQVAVIVPRTLAGKIQPMRRVVKSCTPRRGAGPSHVHRQRTTPQTATATATADDATLSAIIGLLIGAYAP